MPALANPLRLKVLPRTLEHLCYGHSPPLQRNARDMTTPHQRAEARFYAELALDGHRLTYSCWIEPTGHRERLNVFAGRLRRETGADILPLIEEVRDAVEDGDDEQAVVSDATIEVLRRLHEAIGRALDDGLP